MEKFGTASKNRRRRGPKRQTAGTEGMSNFIQRPAICRHNRWDARKCGNRRPTARSSGVGSLTASWPSTSERSRSPLSLPARRTKQWPPSALGWGRRVGSPASKIPRSRRQSGGSTRRGQPVLRWNQCKPGTRSSIRTRYSRHSFVLPSTAALTTKSEPVHRKISSL